MRSLTLVLLFFAGTAFAGPKVATDPRIELHDLPDTRGQWQEGVAVIAAPQEQVRRWLTDYARWAERFPDVAWAQVLPDDDSGNHVVRFHSHIADRTFLIHESVAPDLLVFHGTAPNIYTQGRIYLIDLGGGRTQVLMQSTATVHGVMGLFATTGYRRKSAYRVTASHLTALLMLADTLLAATR